MALKIETKGKTVEPSIYERTFTDGSKKYYAGPQRKDKNVSSTSQGLNRRSKR